MVVETAHCSFEQIFGGRVVWTTWRHQRQLVDETTASATGPDTIQSRVDGWIFLLEYLRHYIELYVLNVTLYRDNRYIIVYLVMLTYLL